MFEWSETGRATGAACFSLVGFSFFRLASFVCALRLEGNGAADSRVYLCIILRWCCSDDGSFRCNLPSMNEFSPPSPILPSNKGKSLTTAAKERKVDLTFDPDFFFSFSPPPLFFCFSSYLSLLP